MVEMPVRPRGHAGVFPLLAAILAAAVWAGPAARLGLAQIGERRTPSVAYYTGFGPFYDGDYADALRIFQAEGRTSIKTAQSRWIDSICYETMCGECYVQIGDFSQALQHYTAALQLFVTFSDWMTKVQFPAAIQLAGAGVRKVVPWGVSTRQSQLGFYRPSMLIAQGQVDLTAVVQQGGIVQQANLFPVTPQEIVRATALALRRRSTLLGPASKFDPLTSDVLAATNRPLSPSNHWSESWANLERGLAMAAAGKQDQAVGYLQRAVSAGGQFDHPLTSVALLELGRLALVQGQYPVAAKFFDEATYAAVNYPDYGVLEEAFRYGMLTHLMANRKGLFAPLEPAIQWAKVNRLRQLRAALLLCAAENYAVLGESRQAATMLDEARATIARRQMGIGWIGARLSYLNALVAYQQKRTAEGNASLAAAMGYMRHGSLWLFHIGLADQLYIAGGATPRATMDLFGEVLRDPQPADWAVDPMESLAVLVTPHPQSLEHWFEAALQRNETQMAAEIAERVRRQRFFLSGVRRPARVAAVDSGSRGGIPAACGATGAARNPDPLSGLRPAFAAGAEGPRGTGENAAGGRRSGGAEGAIAGAGRVGVRQPPAGGAAAGDCPAPRAGDVGLSAAAQRSRRAESSARQTRPLGFLRHQPVHVRIPAEQRAVYGLAHRPHSAVGQTDAGDAPRHGPLSAES